MSETKSKELSTKKSNELSNELSNDGLDQSYENLFREVTAIEQDHIIRKANCKFCNHPIRHQAETRWEQSNFSFAPVERLFAEYEQTHPEQHRMYVQNIRTHLLKHYRGQEKSMWLDHYVGECRQYMNYKISQDKRFEMLRIVLEKQLFEVGSNPNLNPLRQGETLTKIAKILLEIEEFQARLRGEIHPANVVTEKFMNVWLHIINQQTDDQVKKVLINALDVFQENIQGGIVVEAE